jgi:hypothetical protein
VKAPKSGVYEGRPGKLQIYISGKEIQLLSFEFKCGPTTGATSLNSIPLKRSKKGYRFAIKAHGNVTYRDDVPDENGAIEISGRFSRTGKSAGGTMRAKTPRCGGTGKLDWRAHR